MLKENIPDQNELPSSQQLIRSSIIALGVALLLLVTVVMPSEYAMDPTGTGRLLGLTQMGEMKVQLSEEATKDTQQHAGENTATPSSTQTEQSQAQVQSHSHAASQGHIDDNKHPQDSAIKEQPVESLLGNASSANSARMDEMTIELAPNQGAEIKLNMIEGASVDYIWRVEDGTVNYDTHGDPYNAPKGFYHGYGKGRSVPGDKGELIAAFDGKHGWFWRNRTGNTVSVTLKTNGVYSAIERVL